jgi:hypothetical protein
MIKFILTIEDDLILKKHKTQYPQEWKSTWMGQSRGKCLFFGNKQENFEELRERLYEVILKHTLPFPYNKFFIS